MDTEIVVCGIPFGTKEERNALKYVKDNGFTSVQIYTLWRDFEHNKKGQFNWEYYDRQVTLIKEAGLKYVPFILMGPKYASPEWWLNDSNHKGLKCIEHYKETPIESIWNIDFRNEIDRVLKEFAKHYLPWDVLESVQPGICGDYGEAIFPVIGNWPGDYHTHKGYWCGGNDAINSFRSQIKRNYNNIDELNKSWSCKYESFMDIKPFLRHRAPSRTAFLDLILWYKDSMTEYSEFWMRQCRKYFPQTPVYLCTGGIEEPELGASFADQAKIAAKYNCGIRLTNEGNNFYDNFYLTIHMHSACKFYGAYLGLEPVGPIIPQGVTARMYGAAAYGNKQVFHYYGNIVDECNVNRGADRVLKYKDLINNRNTQNNIALFWPTDEATLQGCNIPDNIKSSILFIRKYYEIDVVSEQMVIDGALGNYKLLIMLDTQITRECILKNISLWVKDGGIVLSNKRSLNIEGEIVKEFDSIFGINENSEELWGHNEYFPVGPDWTEKFNSISQIHSSMAWNNLSPEVTPIAKNVISNCIGSARIKEAYCAFENIYGKGKGIFYSGPMDLNAKADAIWKPSNAFIFLLQDCCEKYSNEKILMIEEDEIARTKIGDKMLILKEDEILRNSWKLKLKN